MGGVFKYSNPPVIRWGEGSVRGLGDALERLGVDRPALITTRSVHGDAGLMEILLGSLGARRPVATALIAQHAPVAEIDLAFESVVAAPADGVVSFGGGSPIDAAKIVAVRVGDARGSARPLAHVAVPTTLSMAELAAGAGLTDEAGNKVGFRDPRGLTDAVVYDGSLALSTPIELWLASGIRALDHAVESFLSDGDHPFSDVLALEAVRRLFETLPQACADPSSAAIRTQNQLAAWFSYTLTGPTAAGLGHMMGKQIGARYGIPHGVTSCLLLPHVMRYRATWQAERMAQLPAADDVEALIASLDLPQHIGAYGIGEPDLRAAAEALAGKHSADDLLAVYLKAL